MEDGVIAEATPLTEQFEGFSATPYPDPGSGGEPWTIGFGSTRLADGSAVGPHTPPISRAEAQALLQRDLRSALEQITSLVGVPLTPDELAALDDFVYNEGVGNFARSTLLRMLNAGDYLGAADQLGRWVYGSGHLLPGLVRRRAAERTLFLRGMNDSPA